MVDGIQFVRKIMKGQKGAVEEYPGLDKIKTPDELKEFVRIMPGDTMRPAPARSVPRSEWRARHKFPGLWNAGLAGCGRLSLSAHPRCVYCERDLHDCGKGRGCNSCRRIVSPHSMWAVFLFCDITSENH